MGRCLTCHEEGPFTACEKCHDYAWDELEKHKARVRVLEEALRALTTLRSDCWCVEEGGSHEAACLRARAALADAKGGG